MRRPPRRLFAVLLALLAAAGLEAAAAVEGERGGEVGFFLGAAFTDENLSQQTGGTVEPAFGLRGGSVFARRWIWFADVLADEVSTNGSPLGKAQTFWGRTGFELILRPERRSRWFLNGGAGWMKADYQRSVASDFDRAFISGGLGLRRLLGERLWLRLEVRGDVTVDDSGLDGETVGQGLALAGLTWGPRTSGASASSRDQDGDGVGDRGDRCPDTPAGAIVTRLGCPVDGDLDGVPDGIDRCERTPPSVAVDAAGCPADSDGDGVHDGSDACTGTAPGSVVDDWGCPLDRDRDGVPDGIDRCPRTEPELAVDASGCALDTDGDGVADTHDRCPGTVAGSTVGRWGCPEAGYDFDPARRALMLWLGFESGSARLSDPAREVLDSVVGLLSENRERFEVGGHTDASGAEAENVELSTARARTVRDYLIDAGIDASRLQIQGFGSSRPVVDATNEDERRRNRRVELVRID